MNSARWEKKYCKFAQEIAKVIWQHKKCIFILLHSSEEERKKKVEIYTTFPLSHEQSFPKHQHNLKQEKSEHEKDFLRLGEPAKN